MMKIKKFEKKLALNKKTISNLGDPTMDAIKGGLLWESEPDPSVCHGGGESDPCYSTNIDTVCI
jgi:hypothetical protein